MFILFKHFFGTKNQEVAGLVGGCGSVSWRPSALSSWIFLVYLMMRAASTILTSEISETMIIIIIIINSHYHYDRHDYCYHYHYIYIHTVVVYIMTTMFCNYTGDVHHFIKILVASWKAQHTIPAPGFLGHWHPLSQRSQRTWAWCPPPVAIRHRQLERNAILVGG
jgi:hypothetical protein